MSIMLAPPRAQQSTDSAVSKFVHPLCNITGPYLQHDLPSLLSYVPHAAYFFIRVLALQPDQVHKLYIHSPLAYPLPTDTRSYDLIQSLIPTYRDQDFSLRRVDPRLWATLAQVYTHTLPLHFPRYYHLPLSDTYLPLLQCISSSADFSLVTILELPGSDDLSDANISQLRALHSLFALEASGTKLTDYGIRVLSKTLGWQNDERRGPWPLRILRLRNCPGITIDILSTSSAFPLLTVLDLRGTNCWPSSAKASPWTLSTNCDFYHPRPLRESLSCLDVLFPRVLYASDSKACFFLCIDALRYARSYTRQSPVKVEMSGRRQSSKISRSSHKDSVTVIPLSEDPPELSGSDSIFQPAQAGWMDRIASLEMEQLARAQAVSKFYAGPVTPHVPVVSLTDRIYARQEGTYRMLANSEAMYFRKPPSWSTLADFQKPANSEGAPKQPVIEKAKVSLGGEKARLMSQWQTSFVKDKLKLRENVPTPPAHRLQDSLKGGNPFRRKSEPSSQSRHFQAPSLGQEIDVAASSLLKVIPIDAQSDKKVRPISSFEVPELPQHEKKKLADASRAEVNPKSLLASGKRSRTSIAVELGPPAKKSKVFDMKSWLKKS